MSSSTTTVPSRQPLREVLQGVADPRDRRGVRHDLPTILSLAVTGILAGCESLMAIWEHATDLEALGLEAGRALPSQVHHPTGPPRPGPRGPRGPPDLLVAYAHRHHRGLQGDRGGRVRPCAGPALRTTRRLTCWRPWTRSAESSWHSGGWPTSPTRSPPCPSCSPPWTWTGPRSPPTPRCTQVNTAEWTISRGAHYLLTVKDKQPGLHQTLKDPPWKDIPAISAPDGSHGRRVRRTLKAVQAPRWVDFPGAAQVIQIRRTRTINKRGGGKKKTTEVVYPVLLASRGPGPPRADRGLGPRPLGH